MIRYLAVAGILVCAVPATAQYGVNWPKQPSTFSQVQPGSQKLRVGGVNDFLYTYEVNVIEINQVTPQPTMAPQGALAGCPTGAGQAGADVGTLVTNADKAFAAYKNLFPKAAIPPKSLEQTSTEWRDNVQPLFEKLADESKAAQKATDAIADNATKTACQAMVDSAVREVQKLQDADTRLNHSPHVVEATFTAKNCKSEILTVTEKYNGTPTGQSLTAQFDIECDQVTVGGGVLLTEIQSRTYTSATSPTQTGQFLAVGGTGKFRPTFLVGLTSFNFPFEPFGHKVSSALGDVRLGISTGPVLQNSKSDVSAFGWFIGGTMSFLHRLYLSPGIHIGEFADFPLGFTQQGDPIPANYGALTPNKRWTARFSIGITIKGWDLTKTLKGSQETPPVQPAQSLKKP